MTRVCFVGVIGLLVIGCAPLPPPTDPAPVPTPTTPESKAAVRRCLEAYQSCALPCGFMNFTARGVCTERCEQAKRKCFEEAP